MQKKLALPLLICLLACFCLPAHAANDEVQTQWAILLGRNGQTTPADLCFAQSGGLYIVGSTDSQDDMLGEHLGGIDGFVTRIDAYGNILWTRRLGGSEDDWFSQVLETPDGGCVVLGATYSGDRDARNARGALDAWVVRLSDRGETLWSKCLGGSSDDELLSLSITEEGQYFACGRSQSRNGDLRSNHGSWDAWATLLQPEDGKPLWVYRYGDEGDDVFTRSIPTVDGWLLLGEKAEPSGMDADGNPLYTQMPIVQEISAQGAEMLESAIVLGDTGRNRLTQIVETETGWLLAGEANSHSAFMPTRYGGSDIWLLHMRTRGHYVSWQRSFGGSKDESLHTITPLASGDYMLLCTSGSKDENVVGAHGSMDVWVVRVTSTGSKIWEQALGGSGTSTPAGILALENGGFLVAGTTDSQDGDIGRHTSTQTGFVAHLAPNGNLLKTELVSLTEEIILLHLKADSGSAYLLGTIKDRVGGQAVESLWIAQLLLEESVTP